MSGLRRIDLSADAGEGFDDDRLFAALSSVSVACGGHAGNDATMREAVARARRWGLAIGAHPGYADRERFGRVELGLATAEIAELVRIQVARLLEVVAAAGLPLAQIKPHGALYHRLSADREAAEAFVGAVAALDRGLAIVGFPGSALLAAAAAAGLPSIREGFAERRYGDDGKLVPRTRKDGQLGGRDAVEQASRLGREGGVESIGLHSDAGGAAGLAVEVRRRLEADGFVVAPSVDASRFVALPEVHVVGAAILEEGRVLLTRRAPGMSMAGKWELPGGKVEAGESAGSALAREVAEELGLSIAVGERIGRGTAIHDGRRIVLEVFAARRVGGELRLHEHEEHGWFGAGELAGLDWPEADLPVLPALARRLAGAG